QTCKVLVRLRQDLRMELESLGLKIFSHLIGRFTAVMGMGCDKGAGELPKRHPFIHGHWRQVKLREDPVERRFECNEMLLNLLQAVECNAHCKLWSLQRFEQFSDCAAFSVQNSSPGRQRNAQPEERQLVLQRPDDA